jgi:hypothetical protein
MMYRAGEENMKADALTRRDNETEQQYKIKAEYRTQAFLSQDQVDPRVLQELGIELDEIALAPIEDAQFDEPVGLLDRVLQDNRQTPSLQALREQALREESEFTIEDGLLLYGGRLIVTALEHCPHPVAILPSAHVGTDLHLAVPTLRAKVLRPAFNALGMARFLKVWLTVNHSSTKSYVILRREFLNELNHNDEPLFRKELHHYLSRNSLTN